MTPARVSIDTLAHRLGARLRTRFAPSPTGYLHLGHVVNAIYTWGVASALNGTVLLRLEDHDRKLAAGPSTSARFSTIWHGSA